MQFGHLEDGVPVPAPDHYHEAGHDILNPSRASHLAHGNKEIVRGLPAESAGDGMHWEHLGWDEAAESIVETFQAVADPPRVRSFTPIALKRCLKLVGVWEEVKATLEAAGDEVYEDFLTVTELKEDDPQFAPLLAAAKQRYGAELVDRIVEAASMGTEFVNTLTAADFAGGGE